MRILFIDTSSSKLVLAIASENHLLDYMIVDAVKNHSKITLSKIKEMLDKNALKPNDITKIMVGIGPGSYTGIRIGLTIAKTYAYALNIPLIPISSLELIKDGVDKNNVIALVDARRENVFARIDNKEMFIAIDKLKEKISSNAVITGDEKLKEYFLEYDFEMINYNLIKTISKYFNDEPCEVHKLKPNYLKLTEAEEKM